MIKKVYNSSGKQIGSIEVLPEKIIVLDFKKAGNNLQITDPEIVAWAQNPTKDDHIILRLFDEFFLKIGEIAALCGVLYHRANKWCLELPYKTGKKSGRRNSSYGIVFSPERCAHIKKGINDQFQQLKAQGKKKATYVRTPEIRKKISDSVKKAQREGRLPSPREVGKRGWLKGSYDHTDFKRGIAGFIYSIKNKKDVFFRSLFELFYFLKLEEDDNVASYRYEPFVIRCDDGSTYRPDIRVDKDIIELKSYNYIYKQGGKIQERFEYKVEQAKKYCSSRGLNYRVIYDKDYGFKTDVYKHWLRDHREVLQKFNIRFLQPERVGL